MGPFIPRTCCRVTNTDTNNKDPNDFYYQLHFIKRIIHIHIASRAVPKQYYPFDQPSHFFFILGKYCKYNIQICLACK